MKGEIKPHIACVCVSKPVSKAAHMSCTKANLSNAKTKGRGWQQERESATNEDTLDFLVKLGLIIPAYLPILIASSSFTHVQTFCCSDSALHAVLQVKVYNARGNVIAKVGLHSELSSCEQFSKCVSPQSPTEGCGVIPPRGAACA